MRFLLALNKIGLKPNIIISQITDQPGEAQHIHPDVARVTNSQSNTKTHLSCPAPQLFFNLADDYILTSLLTPAMTHQRKPQCLS